MRTRVSLLFPVVVTALLALGVPARAHEYHKQTFDVAEHLDLFNIALGVAQSGAPFGDGAFYVTGDIYPGGTLDANGNVPPGAVPIGQWFCWGFLNGPFFTATDVYRFDNGQIVAAQAGPLDFFGPLTKSIVGGSGAFKGASGEAEWIRIAPSLDPPNFNFRVTFFK
jgi:hypothetical protein